MPYPASGTAIRPLPASRTFGRSRLAATAAVGTGIVNALMLLMSAAMLALMLKNDHDISEQSARMGEFALVVSLSLQGILEEQARLGPKVDRVGSATERAAGQGGKLIELQQKYILALREGTAGDRRGIFEEIKKVGAERARTTVRTSPTYRPVKQWGHDAQPVFE